MLKIRILVVIRTTFGFASPPGFDLDQDWLQTFVGRPPGDVVETSRACEEWG